MEKIETFGNWMLDTIEPWNWSNSKRYKNYMAIATRDDEGEFHYDWCKMSSERDEFFCVKDVKVGDVLMVGYKDSYKGYGEKVYYKVMAKDEESITLESATTYLKALRLSA